MDSGEYLIHRDTWLMQYQGKATLWNPLLEAPKEPLRGPRGGARAPEAIKAQNQKECHPLNLSAWCDSDTSYIESWISQSWAREYQNEGPFGSTTR